MSDTNGKIAPLIKEILTAIGEEPEREGLLNTPDRVEKSLQYLTKGYDEDPEAVLRSAIFTEEYSEMVIVKNIKVYSLCEHHMLPFVGVAHVAYLPNGKIVGLSKIPRIVDVFARRLQVQERLTHQIAKTIQKVLEPRGVGVVIKAEHMCMQMRGVEKEDSLAVTSAMFGIFRERQETRNEFLQLISPLSSPVQ